jgi:hypothetical protein
VCQLIDVEGASGSGVLIAARNDPILVKGLPIYALLLTAGHVTGKILHEKPFRSDILNISFTFDTAIRYSHQAIIIKEYAEWEASPQIDPKTNRWYVVPNDLAILGLLSPIPLQKTKAAIAITYAPGEILCTVGYPKKPTNIDYCAPILSSEPNANKMQKIEIAFCDFDKRVLSDGVVLNEQADELLIGDYSGTSGMSGAPVFNQRSEIIGINLGGAALRFQYSIGQVIGLARNKKWKRANTKLSKLRIKIEKCHSFNVKELSLYFNRIKNDIGLKDFALLVENASKLMQMMAVHYKHPEKLDHNVSISCTHPALIEVRRASQKFEDMRQTTFMTMKNFFISLIS